MLEHMTTPNPDDRTLIAMMACDMFCNLGADYMEQDCVDSAIKILDAIDSRAQEMCT